MKQANKKCKNSNIYNAVFFRKIKKRPGDIIILHLCTKNMIDDMIYSSGDTKCDKLKLVIMGHFLPFYPHP